MHRRISRSAYQSWLDSFFSNPLKNTATLGRAFLAAHFPGIEDTDVSEEHDHHRCADLLEQRYVQQSIHP